MLSYNNYYNRILKRLNSINEYQEYILGTLTNVNFNPNDGVETKQVINWNDNIPDYLIVEINGEIISRWFVIESRRLLSGQFEIELFRDSLADYYNEILTAPIFVEKGMLDASNPLIFNQEDMTFNQIRQAPTLLKDITKIPWIIGYIPADSDLANKTVNATYNTANNPDIEVAEIANWEFAKYLEAPGYYDYRLYTGFRYSTIEAGNYLQRTCKNMYKGVSNTTIDTTTYSTWDAAGKGTPANGFYNNQSDFAGTYYYSNESGAPGLPTQEEWQTYANKIRTDSQYQSYFTGLMTSNFDLLNEAQYEELNSLNDKTILDTSSNTLFKIRLNIEAVNEELSLRNQQAMLAKLTSYIPPQIEGGAVVDKTFTAVLEGYSFNLSLEQVQTSVTVELSNNRYHLEDQPYDMFCIPYGSIFAFELEEGFKTQNIGTSLASEIAKQLGSDIIYDIQILPYCPIQYAWNDEYHYIDLTKTKYSIIKDQQSRNTSVLIWCRNSSFNFNIEFYLPDRYNAIEKKISSQTEIYRLVSPNGNGIFEFNPYKNGGVDYFRVDCSYKPFNPYIRIAPIFKNLYGYGGQYDYRGLILGGDFSITQLNNAWANYQLNNKNYQAIFDRRIENMEVNNKYQKTSDIINAITGSGTAAIGGAITGATIGGSASASPYGAIAGAAVGATAGVASGIIDIVRNERLRNEAIDYTKDNFGYQLGNIQAIPTSVSKTTAITINNPLIPMLEFYKCTVQETEAFRNKIKYNGMTVMAIDTMSNYTEGYFKGKLIRLENIAEDFHIVNVIAKELYKGVYLNEYTI